MADHDGLVCALDGMLGDLFGKRKMRAVVLGHQQYAGGIPVDPVHDARAQHPADAAEPVQMFQQRVDQRPVRVSRRRMHYHAARLEHHGHVLILIQNVQRDVLRSHLGRLRLGDLDGNLLAALQLQPRLFRPLAVHQHRALFDQARRARTGDLGRLRHEHIQPSGLSRNRPVHALAPFAPRPLSNSHNMTSPAPQHTQISATLKMAKRINSRWMKSIT